MSNLSTTEAALIVVVVVGVALAGSYFVVEKAKRQPSERAQIIAAARARTGLDADDEHDVGPDALRLLEALDAHLDGYLVQHPDVADGFARLRQAVRDEQQKGEA
jgi:hypothetical protein